MNFTLGTAQTLQCFVVGDMSVEEFEAWLVGVQDDESLLSDERAELATLRLLALEAGEDLRTETDVRFAAAAILATEEATTFVTSSNATAEPIEAIPVALAVPSQ